MCNIGLHTTGCGSPQIDPSDTTTASGLSYADVWAHHYQLAQPPKRRRMKQALKPGQLVWIKIGGRMCEGRVVKQVGRTVHVRFPDRFGWKNKVMKAGGTRRYDVAKVVTHYSRMRARDEQALREWWQTGQPMVVPTLAQPVEPFVPLKRAQSKGRKKKHLPPIFQTKETSLTKEQRRAADLETAKQILAKAQMGLKVR